MAINNLKDAINPRKTEPTLAAIEAHKNDGNIVNAIADPGELYLKQPKSEAQLKGELDKFKKKKKKKRYMAKGGSTNCCRGMGAATRGGGFGRNG